MRTDEQATATDHEVAAPEAWDAIAAGYDEFVAPGEAPLAHAGLALAAWKRVTGSSMSRPDRAA